MAIRGTTKKGMVLSLHRQKVEGHVALEKSENQRGRRDHESQHDSMGGEITFLPGNPAMWKKPELEKKPRVYKKKIAQEPSAGQPVAIVKRRSNSHS